MDYLKFDKGICKDCKNKWVRYCYLLNDGETWLCAGCMNKRGLSVIPDLPPRLQRARDRMKCEFCPNGKLNPTMAIEDVCMCSDAYDAIQCCCSLCGCGSEQVPNLLMEVLQWCDLNHASKQSIKDGCYSSPAWELAAKVLDEQGFIEHGTGIGWPWTTDKGKKFLVWAKDNQPKEQP